MDFILQHLRSTPEYQSFLQQVQDDTRLPALGLPRAARLPLMTGLHLDLNRPILLLTDRADHALALYDELSFWMPSSPRFLFSEPNPLFYEEAAWGNVTRRERLQTLTALALYHLRFAEKPSTPLLIVASARAVMTRTLPRRDFLKASKRLSVGQTVSPDALIRHWISIGYQSADTVLEAGQFSRRGGILDLWPPSAPAPLRFDFFGDELDTLRSFDPATQRTLEKLQSVLVTPAREFLLPILENSKFDNSDSQDGESRISNIEYRISTPDPTEFHIPVLHPTVSSLLDYLPQRALILVDDLSLIETMVGEVEEQAVKFRHESIEEGVLTNDFPVPYLSLAELTDSIQSHPWLELGHSADEVRADDHPLREIFGHGQRFGGRLKPFVEYLTSLTAQGDRVVVVSRQAERLQELWEEQSAENREQRAENPQFIEASLSDGFILHSLELSNIVHLISDSEIFGWERPTPRARQQSVAETPEAAFADLRAGDYVVHVDFGIGRFAGLVKRLLDGHEREFLLVEYDNGGQIYIPVHQADRLTRYIGAQGVAPTLSRLGGMDWANTKDHVREAVQQIAEDLLQLYAQRQTAQGYAFHPDTPWQSELEDSFPYADTPDQRLALAAIKKDMETPRPMDRLLCGDVGYGKTEVALRAAFKAVMDGRQVAVLVPTTVLAQQHYDTFTQRLAAFPVKVEMLSRFRTPREQNEIIRQLLLGNVDIIIGTHRLISQDVEFKDLGLVIIDEEQRFGVTHKEHFKKLRTEVDVLTLTATPIPRTLYMALTGVRDISTLNTPPEERLPIITHVGPYSPRLVRQAVLRELERGGQIFFVHNRVQTIHAMQMHLKSLVPQARVGVGHGQLPEGELAEIMHKFTSGQIDILLATTIIESGLDIPNANTLIVDRADTFGLAQLYQLRGRVGRASQRAYAYFFRHRKKSPTLEGQERLEVIAENTQLGAGYSIAMRDLEIRGAGELLGAKQSGHIASVGFHLYTRMLAQAVRQLKVAAAQVGRLEGLNVDLSTIQPSNLSTYEQELKEPVTVDLPLAIGIPAAYVHNQDLRLRLYRRIASMREEREIEPLAEEFADRFGPMPLMVQNLFYQMRIKLRADAVGIQSVSLESGQIVLRYPILNPNMAQRMLPDLGAGVRGGKNAYWCNFVKDENWQERLLDVLERLQSRVVDVV
jgi:transcription-repair coupling factor (superfamily II helicase)